MVKQSTTAGGKHRGVYTCLLQDRSRNLLLNRGGVIVLEAEGFCHPREAVDEVETIGGPKIIRKGRKWRLLEQSEKLPHF